ncbi:MAG: DUF2442 domain-containing protein [Cyanobacteria bacterium P01_D01_bin.1]
MNVSELANAARDLEEDRDIDAAIKQWNEQKHCRIAPTDIRYLSDIGKAVITFENGSSYQFNPLHIQEVTLEISQPTEDQLADVMLRAGGESLYWPQLDASIGIDNLLLGRYGTNQWIQRLRTTA